MDSLEAAVVAVGHRVAAAVEAVFLVAEEVVGVGKCFPADLAD